MILKKNFIHSAGVLFLTLLTACSSNLSQQEPPDLIPSNVENNLSFRQPENHGVDSSDKILNDFYQLDSMLSAAKSGDDATVGYFLSTQKPSAMAESVRNEWLKNLGKRGQYQLFAQEYAKLASKGIQQENRCYAQYFHLEKYDADFINELVETTAGLPEGCDVLLTQLITQNQVRPERAWRRVRGLISNGRITAANRLASALGSPLNSSTGQGYQENLLRDIISPNAQKSPDAAASRLQNLSGSLNNDQTSFAWGVLALAHAKNQNFAQALNFYHLSNANQLNTEQFEWYARSALRLQQWNVLHDVINSMPKSLQQTPTWQYWLARALSATGQPEKAEPLYQKAAQSGRNFYAVLATEELGGRINTQTNVSPANTADVNTLAKNGAIARALTLYHASKQYSNTAMRRQAQNEWRFATRDFDESALLVAAQLAYNNEFYEMAINSADKTNVLLNYQLRYLTPFQDLVQMYSRQNGVDAAWVYGLIRQESRFMIGAQSNVGAQGLMQVMPATAREIARKIGMDSSELYTMNGNILMGTWYMADTKNRLQNNEVLATAGYNAGPGRARKWQGYSSLEGAIYAETIPFNETRDYVKKVMTNTAYYTSLFGRPVSLKQRMGYIPAK